jgi:FeS assembly SUF system protein
MLNYRQLNFGQLQRFQQVSRARGMMGVSDNNPEVDENANFAVQRTQQDSQKNTLDELNAKALDEKVSNEQTGVDVDFPLPSQDYQQATPTTDTDKSPIDTLPNADTPQNTEEKPSEAHTPDASSARRGFVSDIQHPLYTMIIDAVRTVYDPELPVNLYDLGLIYTIAIDEDNHVDIEMTLTTPGCPVAGEMPGMVASAVEPLPGVRTVDVVLVWDPPWDISRMSEEARLELGLL